MAAAPAVLAIIVLLGEAGCQDKQPREPTILRGRAMGTTWMVRLAEPLSPVDTDHRRRQIAAVIESVEAEMSHWREDSDVSRFNRWESRDRFPISARLAEVLNEAVRIHRLSCGAFDITAAPLVELWGFGPAGLRQAAPSLEEVDAARRHVSAGNLLVESDGAAWQARKREPLLRLDLSSLAKGYAIDCVADFCTEEGIERFLIELGGELRARGVNSSGSPWRVGLEAPEAKRARRVRRSLDLCNAAVATSGSYRRFFAADDSANGLRSHLIDPRSGRPVEHSLVSVSVVAKSAMSADAWATALFVLGPEAGLAIAERKGIAATFVQRREGELIELQTAAFPAKE